MPKKILIVDDDPALVKMIVMVLTKKGYEVIKASDGQEALQVLFDSKPDLVLLDVVMPKMNGWQTCSRIRDFSSTVPIIILSGKKMTEDDVVRGLDYGADEYLLKPVGSKELVARVRAILRRAELPPYSGKVKEITFNDGSLTVNVMERKITVNGERIKLTPIEFRLLALLLPQH